MPTVHCRGGGENAAVPSPVEESLVSGAGDVLCGTLFGQSNDAIGGRPRERAEQDCEDDAEDRGVGADAEGQRQDRGRREGGAGAHGAQGVADGRQGHGRY